jgi:hypothetical protein
MARFKPPAFTDAGLLRLGRLLEALGKAGIAVTCVEIDGGKIRLHSTKADEPEQDEGGDAYLARFDQWQGRS